MDRVVTTAVPLINIILFMVADVSCTEGYCKFPELVWKGEDAHRMWYTRVHYDNVTSSWYERTEVTARRTSIVVQKILRKPCVTGRRKQANTPLCEKTHREQQWVCVSEEAHGQYRILIREHGKNASFSCIKFTRRNGNVIQLWSAVHSDLNVDQLCYETSLTRDEWPWFDIKQREFAFCPSLGGYDFSAQWNGSKHKKVCRDDWLPSRIESECIKGEGVNFFFREEKCNLFGNNQLESRLYCWAWWKEDANIYLLLSWNGETPQFSMRLPTDYNTTMNRHFMAYLYFNPIMPGPDPLEKTLYARLRMTKSESGVCYDESAECAGRAKQGRCTSQDMHLYGNYCRRSCKLCGLRPSTSIECHFEQNQCGKWLWYENDQKQEVVITKGNIEFSQLGTFICKSKHWDSSYYKLFSVYENGCRPRYTCVDLSTRGDNTLQIRLSGSSLDDKRFDICEFKDDDTLLGQSIRSRQSKLLLSSSHLQRKKCGLIGRVTATVRTIDSRGRLDRCNTTVNDWDERTCKAKPTLRINTAPCYRHLIQDYPCEGYLHVGDGRSLLMTEHVDQSPRYRCWLIDLNGQRYPENEWSGASLLQQAQCAVSEEWEIQKQHAITYIQTLKVHSTKHCLLRRTSPSYNQMTTTALIPRLRPTNERYGGYEVMPEQSLLNPEHAVDHGARKEDSGGGGTPAVSRHLLTVCALLSTCLYLISSGATHTTGTL